MLSTRVRRSFCSPVLVLAFLALATPAIGAGYWQWYTGMTCTSNGTTTLGVQDGFTSVSTTGSVLFIDLQLPGNVVVDSLAICFTNGGGGGILGMKLVEYRSPGTVNRFTDGALRSAPSLTCFTLDVPDFSPQGPIALELPLFSMNSVTLYSIGVKIGQTVLAVTDDPRPTSQALALRNAPNPFDTGTAIEFTLVRSGAATLQVYDAAGRRIRTLAVDGRTAGPQRVIWDRRGDDGRTLDPGVYFYELVTPNGRVARRAVVLR